MKTFFQVLICLLITICLTGAVSAVNNVTHSTDVQIDYVKINGDQYESGDTLKVDLGDTLNIRVKVSANRDAKNIEISTRLVGYEYSSREDVTDTSDTLDLKQGDTEYVDLKIKLPVRAEKDRYDLRVDVDGRTTNFESKSFSIRVAGPRKAVIIRDVILSPNDEIASGRALLAQARLENIGERDEDDVKVTFTIEALDVQGSVYMDKLEGETSLGRGEKKTSEEVYLRIPPCAKPGKYDLVATVNFDEFEETTVTRQITVVDGGLCAARITQPSITPDQTFISAPASQTIQIGVGGASYPVTIQNKGASSKAYIIKVTGVDDWGTYKIDDMAPIIAAGSSKTVYIYVSARDNAVPGTRVIAIEVATTDGAKNTVTTQALLVPVAASESNLKTVLQWGVAILVLILVILGLILLFSMKKNKDDEERDDLDSKGQAYY